MREMFVRLTRELGTLLDVSPPSMAAGEPEAMQLRLDDIDFMVAHRHTPHGMLSIGCNFGPLPDPSVAELLRLLEINLTLGAACAGTLGVDSQTREVVYLFHAPLQGLSAHLLLDTLKQAARQAHAWRKGVLTPATPTATTVVPAMPLDTLA